MDDSDHADRVLGYGDAFLAVGLPVDPQMIVRTPATRPGGKQIIRRLMAGDHCPTAIYLADPMAAVAAMHELMDMGIKVPTDVSLVGFDDGELRHLMQPTMTAVCQDAREVGREAFEMLHGIIDGNGKTMSHRRILPTILEIHGSTAAGSQGVAGRGGWIRENRAGACRPGLAKRMSSGPARPGSDGSNEMGQLLAGATAAAVAVRVVGGIRMRKYVTSSTRRTASLAVAAAAALAAAQALANTNIIQNGGFEASDPAGGSSVAQYWNQTDPSITRDTSNPHTGVAEEYLNNTTAPSASFLYQDTPAGSVTPGSSYTLDFFYAGTVTEGELHERVVFFGSGGPTF